MTGKKMKQKLTDILAEIEALLEFSRYALDTNDIDTLEQCQARIRELVLCIK